MFADFILNLQGLDGTAHIDVRDNLGNVPFFDLVAGPGNGSNFLTITIDADQFAAGVRIAGVFVNAPDGFDVFKQPRISGVCDPAIQGCGLVPIQAPEPASLAMLGGALIGLAAASSQAGLSDRLSMKFGGPRAAVFLEDQPGEGRDHIPYHFTAADRTRSGRRSVDWAAASFVLRENPTMSLAPVECSCHRSAPKAAWSCAAASGDGISRPG